MLLEEVFGITPEILESSYVDRNNLDSKFQRLLRQHKHITLYGASKCGKSWFRKKNIPNALTVQCRHQTTLIDIYVDALSQLDIKFIVEESKTNKIKGVLEATGEFGVKLLSKLTGSVSISAEREGSKKETPVGKNIEDLRFIADIINASEKRLVIEDFHYLASVEKSKFAYDLKALWDYSCFVVVIGVWSQSGYINVLNPDLAVRTKEITITWSKDDLEGVIMAGSKVLKVKISEDIKNKLINDSYGNVGITQTLLYNLMSNANIYKTSRYEETIQNNELYVSSANELADDLNSLYHSFANSVSAGIRKRGGSATEIYAHALAVILESDDDSLISGLHLDKIFEICHKRQKRIIKPNLQRALSKIEELQVDEENRGLVLAYNDKEREVFVIDRQLMFYRKYRTIEWPWEEMIREIDGLTSVETEW